jgi:probable phosphoglycerate mutase
MKDGEKIDLLSCIIQDIEVYADTMRCYIVRHADKEWGGFYNPRLRHQDEPISQKGRQQAQKLVDFFTNRPVSTIYVSGYQRTLQTAEFVARQLQLTPIVDERLNEFDNGLIEGLTDEQIHESYPDVWQAFRARSADFRFPGGENGAEAQARIVEFLQERDLQHTEDDVLAFSHDGLIRTLMCAIFQLPVYARWNFQIDFCGITEIVAQPGPIAWKLVRFNHTVS